MNWVVVVVFGDLGRRGGIGDAELRGIKDAERKCTPYGV